MGALCILLYGSSVRIRDFSVLLFTAAISCQGGSRRILLSANSILRFNQTRLLRTVTTAPKAAPVRSRAAREIMNQSAVSAFFAVAVLTTTKVLK